MLPIAPVILRPLCLCLHPRGFGFGPFAGLDVLRVPSNGIAVASDSWFEPGIVGDPFVVAVCVWFLLAHDHLGLIIDPVLFLIFGELVAAVAHRFEHNFMLDFASPDLLFLFLDLMRPLVRVGDVRQMLKELGFNLGSGICYDVAGLSFNLSVLVLAGFLLGELLFLLVGICRVGAISKTTYMVREQAVGLNSVSCMGERRCIVF